MYPYNRNVYLDLSVPQKRFFLDMPVQQPDRAEDRWPREPEDQGPDDQSSGQDEAKAG